MVILLTQDSDVTLYRCDMLQYDRLVVRPADSNPRSSLWEIGRPDADKTQRAGIVFRAESGLQRNCQADSGVSGASESTETIRFLPVRFAW